MYGAFFYGIANRLLVDLHRSKVPVAEKLDMKDFLHSNSPYLKSYIRPTLRENMEVDSVSPDTGDDMLSPSPV